MARARIDELGFPLFLSASIALGFRVEIENDLYWHVAIGRWIIQHCRVPTEDPFSFSLPGVPWSPPEWASEVVWAGIHELFDLQGLLALRLLILVLVMSFVFVRSRERGAGPLTSFAVSAACSLSLPVHFAPRPLIVGHLSLAILFWHLDRVRRSETSPSYAIALGFVLWANLHPSWMLGLAVLWLHTAILALAPRWENVVAAVSWERDPGGSFFSRWMSNRLGSIGRLSIAYLSIERIDPLALRRLWWIALSSTLLVWIQPRGIHGALYPLVHMIELGELSSQWLAEWRPPPWDVSLPWLSVAAVVMLWSLQLRQRSAPLIDLLVSMAVLYLALRHTRFLVFIPILIVPLLAGQFRPSAATNTAPQPLAHALLGFVGLVLMARTIPSEDSLRAVEAASYPRRQVEWIREHPDAAGRTFSTFEAGGYLLEQLPNRRVFIDSRFDLYALHGVFERYLELDEVPVAREVLEQYQIGTILVSEASRRRLAGIWLEANELWNPVVVTRHWTLFLRAGDGENHEPQRMPSSTTPRADIVDEVR